MQLEAGFAAVDGGFDLRFGGRLVLCHRPETPVLDSARGNPTVLMYRGNFRIDDAPDGLITPLDCAVDAQGVTLSHGGAAVARLELVDHCLTVSLLTPGHDRIRLRWHGEPDEAVWGGGEQMSYLALNGRAFPMWTSEPGVGRDKSTELTRQMDESGMAGGDYWNTNYPQPTILTSRWLAIHLDATCYSVVDCTDAGFHAFDVWSDRATFELYAAEGPLTLVSQLSTRFGRQPPLPDWALGGAIVGLKDGTRSFERLDGFKDGAWWVQDLAASLPARLLGAGEGRRVLDLCAAPGGKTMQLAAKGWQVTALDAGAKRLQRMQENLARTGLGATLVQADALQWQPDAQFDAVLLDAPCTATGTCRRHPDVLHRIGHRQIAELAELQARLLERARAWVKPGGRLVYATCSLERAEGEDQAALVGLSTDPIRAEELPAGLVPTDQGWLRTDPAMLPDAGGLDGFFIARWRA